MDRDNTVSWLLQTAGGIILIVITALIAAIRKDNAAIWEEHGSLRNEHNQLRSDHSGLAARVQAERDDTLRTMNRIESKVDGIMDRLTDLLESVRGDHTGRRP